MEAESSGLASLIETEEWSDRTFDCNLGRSFLQSNATDAFGCNYCTMRYDFKPASLNVDGERHADVSVNKRNGEVSVTFLPSSSRSSQEASAGSKLRSQLFKGNSQPATKECVLIYDRETGEFTLERVEAAVRLKKTREATAEPPSVPTEVVPKRAPPVTSKARSNTNGASSDSQAGLSQTGKRKLASLSDPEDDDELVVRHRSDEDSSRDANGVDESATRHALATMTSTLHCSRLENDLRLSEDSSDDDDDDDQLEPASQLAPRLPATRLLGAPQAGTLTDSSSSDSEFE